MTALLKQVEELRAAAQRVREAASAATPGPWSASPVWSPDSPATSAVYSYAHPTGTAASEVIPSRRAKKKRPPVRPGDAAWIGLMHPGLAEPLATWLDAAAEDLAAAAASYPATQEGYDPVHLCDEPDSVLRALTLARLLIGDAR